ncbi:MAG: hypothetical protein KA006_01115 [Neisseria sp.]|nr:hypothetical protein [Neisseria sp.]
MGCLFVSYFLEWVSEGFQQVSALPAIKAKGRLKGFRRPFAALSLLLFARGMVLKTLQK